MWDHFKRNPYALPLVLILGFVALLNWPITLVLTGCAVAIVVMDEVLHLPKWATSLLANLLLVAALAGLAYWTDDNPGGSDDPPVCSTLGC